MWIEFLKQSRNFIIGAIKLLPTIILRTAFSTAAYRNINSPVSEGKERLNQYEIGLNTLIKKIPFIDNLPKILVDNTINSILEVPSSYRNLSNVQIILTKTNKYGVLNKGAGDIETYKYLYRKGCLQDSYYFFYEPRLKLEDPSYILNFYHNPRQMICAPEEIVGVRSGYYGFHGENFQEFILTQNPKKMVRKKTSIEIELYKFAINDGWEINKKGGYCSRFDPIADKYISY